jgi:hypothetical protein
LLESVDCDSVVATLGVVLDVDAAVQLLDRSVKVGPSAKGNDGDMSRSAIFSSENRGFLNMLLVLIQSGLLGLVSSVELRHDLLVRSFPVALFVGNSALCAVPQLMLRSSP